jgi:hypothetical protein
MLCYCWREYEDPALAQWVYETYVDSLIIGSGCTLNDIDTSLVDSLAQTVLTNAPGGLVQPCSTYTSGDTTKINFGRARIPLCWSRTPNYNQNGQIIDYSYHMCGSYDKDGNLPHCVATYNQCIDTTGVVTHNLIYQEVGTDDCTALPTSPAPIINGTCYKYNCGDNPNH